MKTNDFAYYLTNFLSKYMPSERGASTHTIASYRDTFKLFLNYMRDAHNLPAHKIKLKSLTKDKIVAFLNWLEAERGCAASTSRS